MSEQELALAEPPARPKNQQEDTAVVQPEFVVGMPVASVSETSADTQESENATPSAGTELPQFVVDQEAAQQAREADFTLHQQQFSELDTGTLQYVLEQFTTDKLSEVTALESAGLLLAIRDNSDVLVTPGEKLVLQDIVESDAAAAERYWQEVYGSENPQDLTESIQALAESDLQTDVSGSELQAVTDALSRQEAALLHLQEQSPILAEAIQLLERERARRENVIISLVHSTSENSEQILDIPDEASIASVQRENDTLLVSIANENGSEQIIPVQELSIWKYLLTISASDLLLGTNKVEKLLASMVKEHVAVPILSKLGIDVELFFDTFGQENYTALNGMFKNMNEQQCNDFFKQSLEGNYLFDTLLLAEPTHLQKIFAPTGTQSFGSSGLFGYDHLVLPQELVDKMYTTLTDRQREKLRIPPKRTE